MSPSQLSAEAPTTADAFNAFWQDYPRKVSKRAAIKAWEQEIKAGTDPRLILDGLRRQLPMLRSRDPQFIPHAATWIRGGRFEDEIEMPARNNGRRTIADAAEEFDARYGNLTASLGLPGLPRH